MLPLRGQKLKRANSPDSSANSGRAELITGFSCGTRKSYDFLRVFDFCVSPFRDEHFLEQLPFQKSVTHLFVEPVAVDPWAPSVSRHTRFDWTFRK